MSSHCYNKSCQEWTRRKYCMIPVPVLLVLFLRRSTQELTSGSLLWSSYEEVDGSLPAGSSFCELWVVTFFCIAGGGAASYEHPVEARETWTFDSVWRCERILSSQREILIKIIIIDN